MDITRETFHSVAPAVAEYIKSCDFYSVDTELTGINMADLMGSALDTPEVDFYIKTRTAMRYALIQFGICTFHRVPAGEKSEAGANVVKVGGVEFVARPFNFFLFPSTQPNNDHLGRDLERDLVMSPSSIAFNRKHGMNFQKWITQGVEYCNAAQEEGILRLIKQEEDADEEKRNICSTLEKTLRTLANENEKAYLTKCAGMAEKFVKEGTTKELMMSSPPTRAVGEILRYYIEGQFPGRVTVTAKGRYPNRCPTFTRMTEDEAELYKNRQAVAKGRRVTDFVGFRSLYKTMVECKKPVIGHSFLADILFTIAAFDEDPGGTELCKGKKAILERFPMIFDTKAISFDEQFFPRKRFIHRSLENLSDHYSTSPASPHLKVVLPLGFQNYEQETLMKAKQGNVPSAAHEAGYDALMTGVLWLNLLTEAKILDPSKFSPESSDAAFAEFMEKAKSECGNKIYLHRSLYTMDLNNHHNEEREQQVEGGANDIFNAANDGVLYLTYPTTTASHDVESKIQGMGFPGVALEIRTGCSVMRLDVESCSAIAKAKGKPINEAVSIAISESPLGSLINCQPFFPYHLRPRPENGQPGVSTAPGLQAKDFTPVSPNLYTQPPNYAAAAACLTASEQKRRMSYSSSSISVSAAAAFSYQTTRMMVGSSSMAGMKLSGSSMTRLLIRRR